jgi:DNA replication and repair protein RecF
VYLTNLSLTNFRNYVRLELDFPGRLTLVQGANAQGKTSLLEAIYYLATSKSPHADSDRELVNFLAREDSTRFVRVLGKVQHGPPANTPEQLEVLLAPANGDTTGYTKRVRLNGVVHRVLDLVGHVRVVLFLPEDIELVTGAPSVRRRYLDIALCQIDPVYLRTLSTWNQVLAQRNALLRRLREQGGSPQQLEFWDEKLITLGSYLTVKRQWFVAALDAAAGPRQRALTEDRERVVLEYVPSVDVARDPIQTASQLALRYEVVAEPAPDAPAITQDHLLAAYRAQLAALRSREIMAAMTLLGPHRDELRFRVQGRDLRTYGSRGQQRTATLALKLAEFEVMREASGEPPVLLLDDVMSELDAQRRAKLLQALEGVAQAIITTTDWDDFTPEFRAHARCLTVAEGRVTEMPDRV